MAGGLVSSGAEFRTQYCYRWRSITCQQYTSVKPETLNVKLPPRCWVRKLGYINLQCRLLVKFDLQCWGNSLCWTAFGHSNYSRDICWHHIAFGLLHSIESWSSTIIHPSCKKFLIKLSPKVPWQQLLQCFISLSTLFMVFSVNYYLELHFTTAFY